MPARQGKDTYSTTTGVVFLFNLIVGTGALALPAALQKSGAVIGVILILILALFSLITVTFIVEALATANALSRKRYENQEPSSSHRRHIEETPLVPPQDHKESEVFEITEKYEIGQMGVLMTPKWCQILIYFCLCVYLFGDIAIYEAVVGKTGAHVICTYKGNSTTVDDTSAVDPCWENHSITKKNMYRLVIAVFVLLLGPFVFFNLQKTKSLQIITVIMRWLAFFIMIIWAIFRFCEFGKEGDPALADYKSFPTLFGTLVYSFMCQHSIPGLLYPIGNKKYLTAIIGFDYALVAVFYVSLCLTAVFAFKEIEVLYTLNFFILTSDSSSFTFQRFLAYYLALFPIFTLSTSFPIISITLRNNLRSMFMRNSPPVWYYDRLLFPLLTLIPPTVLAIIVSDLHLLVGVIGSYAGTGIQYLIPCLLVIFARQQVNDIKAVNIHASPFRCTFWIYAVFVWMFVSLIFISVNYATSWK